MNLHVYLVFKPTFMSQYKEELHNITYKVLLIFTNGWDQIIFLSLNDHAGRKPTIITHCRSNSSYILKQNNYT